MPAAGKAQQHWFSKILRGASVPTVPGKAFWAIPPSLAVTPYLRSAKQSINATSEALAGWDPCTWRRVHKASSICMICFNMGYFRFKMCLNYHPRLIPATGFALYRAIDLIIFVIPFLFLFWVSSGGKKKPKTKNPKPKKQTKTSTDLLFYTLCWHRMNLVSQIPLLSRQCRSPVKNLQLLKNFECISSKSIFFLLI